MSRSESIVVVCSWNVARRRDLSTLVADLSDAQLVAGGGHAALLQSDWLAVARGLSNKYSLRPPCAGRGLDLHAVANDGCVQSCSGALAPPLPVDVR